MSVPDSIQERFRKLRVCVLVPTYNNQGTLRQVLDSVLAYTDQVVIVNDGSTDATPDILKSYTQLQIVSYEKNVGKGWALRKGFEKALALGYDYAITIDSDGQHFAEDLPKFLNMVEEAPGSLAIGARNMDQSSVPTKSNFGNAISNYSFWFETGFKMSDTQSGYRLYPIYRMGDIKFITKKFEFEIEVIVRLAWRDVNITSVPVKVFYAQENRVSHFRPLPDFTRVSIIHTVLVTIALVYIKPRNFFRKLKKKTLDERFEVISSTRTNRLV